LLALAGALACPAIAAPASVRIPGQVTTELPRDVRPTHYDVTLNPHPAGMRFDGEVTIDIDVLKAVDSVTLNAVDLQFRKASLVAKPGTRAAPLQVSVDSKAQTASFRAARAIAPGHYRLKLAYDGKINSQAFGLFALDYGTGQAAQRALFTQFENSDARCMIPSWDEPEYKATFSLHAIVPQGQMAISNMPMAAQHALGDGNVDVQFVETPKMSTYLLFFGVGEFDRLKTQAEGVELGVITRKGASGQAAYALDAAKGILHEYNDYFGVRFPLPKLDNIAGPGSSQFFGAMENWGAIFSFEHTMLLDPAISTQRSKEGVFEVEAHEMAHQWFGDLVTMHWWDDLWLNEGFASWMESRTTARLHPEWHTELHAVENREGAMVQDAAKTSHPVIQHIATVEQASQAFDAITYQKGSAVIAMLENYVGEDNWRAGVRAYFKAHAYGNTTSDDLWQELDKVAGKPVSAIAHDFTLQPGVPLIRVDAAVCKDGNEVVHLSQSEFSKDQDAVKAPARIWLVPVRLQTVGTNQVVQALVKNGAADVTVPGCGPVLLNAGQAGYYRALYQPELFAGLAGKFAELPAIDQIGMMTDSLALGLNGAQPLSDFLELANAIPVQADPQVWGEFADKFGLIYQEYRGDPVRQRQFGDFAISRLQPKMQSIGWSAVASDDEGIVNLREKLIRALGELNDPLTVAEARRRFALRKTDPTALPVALRRTVTQIVAVHADAATWDALHAAAKEEDSRLVKEELYNLLASSEDDALAHRALDLALEGEAGPTAAGSMIAAVARRHPELAFDFALAHLEQVERVVDASSRSRYFPRLAAASIDPAMPGKLLSYANAHLDPSARHDAEEAIANISYRIAVKDQRLPAIDAWLAARHG
jgi:aminopeptidase N